MRPSDPQARIPSLTSRRPTWPFDSTVGVYTKSLTPNAPAKWRAYSSAGPSQPNVSPPEFGGFLNAGSHRAVRARQPPAPLAREAVPVQGLRSRPRAAIAGAPRTQDARR